MREITKNPDDFSVYLTADCGYTIRISTPGKRICTLSVQQDPRTMIMLQANTSQNVLADFEKAYPKTFRGDFSIRIAAIPDDVEDMLCREIMNNAFFSLELEGAVVEISREAEKH